MKNRNYCFTSWIEPKITSEIPTYYIYQKELSPTTKREHWQGYIELSKPCRVSFVKSILGDKSAHIEARKGTADQAIEYCKKLESRIGKTIEFGFHQTQGNRSDLTKVVKMIDEGKNLEEVARANPLPFIKFERGLTKYQFITQVPPHRRKISVYLLWGRSGTFKTDFAISKAIKRNEEYFILNQNTNNTLWWDGYTGQRILIIDDFEGWIAFRELIKIIDIYRYRCQTKGGQVWAWWRHVFITSNIDYHKWFPFVKNIVPLTRRITKIKYFA